MVDLLQQERDRLNLARVEKLREKQPAVLKRKAEREAQRAAYERGGLRAASFARVPLLAYDARAMAGEIESKLLASATAAIRNG